MSYKRVKMLGANCPNCQKKLEILLKDSSQEVLCMCFRCREIYLFDGQAIHRMPAGKPATKQEKIGLAGLVQALPEKITIKGGEVNYVNRRLAINEAG